MTLESIKGILESRRFPELIGLHEDLWFEAKGNDPYDFATAGGRYELAKDVSAFANAEGGFLIIGLVTERLTETRTEKVTSFDLCGRDQFDVGQYQGIIGEYIYPGIQDLGIRWTVVDEEGARGLGIVEIPAQPAKLKHFLTARLVEAGSPIRQIVFGLAKRSDSANDPLSVAELHKHMQNGKHTVPQTLARLEEKIDGLIQLQARPSPPEPGRDDLYSQRAAQILEDDA